MRLAGHRASALATGIAATFVAGFAFSVSGCFSPTINDGDFQCAVSDPKCPPGYTCGADNKCSKGGGVVVDAGTDAPPVEAGAPMLMVALVVDLQKVVFGTTATAMRTTVRNTGSGPSTAVMLVPAGPDSSSFKISNDMCLGKVLMPNDTCTFDVGNDPNATLGMKNATVGVMGDGTRHDIALKMEVISILGVMPLDHLFPDTMVNPSAAPQKSFEFMNIGTTQRADGLQATITGPNASDFAIVSGLNFCAGTNLAPGTSCTVTVSFRPTTAGANKTATLQLTSRPGGPASAMLSGNTN